MGVLLMVVGVIVVAVGVGVFFAVGGRGGRVRVIAGTFILVGPQVLPLLLAFSSAQHRGLLMVLKPLLLCLLHYGVPGKMARAPPVCTHRVFLTTITAR